MSDNTHIQWADATWNPITGCSVVSAGCKNCYAMRLAGGRLRNHPSRIGLTRVTGAGPVWTGAVRLNEAWLYQPLRWRRPRRIFVCAHGDLFHPEVPDEWIDRVFAVMALAPWHTFQVLTKRPMRMLEYMMRPKRPWPASLTKEWLWPLPNVWLGVSAENQETANERIPLLLQTPAAVRFVSAEPLLGPVDLAQAAYGLGRERPDAEIQARQLNHPAAAINWTIVGGESGRGARACEVGWIRDIVRQCREARVPCFVKQLGADPIVYHSEAMAEASAGRRIAWDDSGEQVSAKLVLRSRAGSDPGEWPGNLNVREFPK